MTEQSKTPRTDALEIPSELLLLLKTPLMGAAIKIAAKTLYDHANKLEAELTEATAENVRICADYERAFNRGLKAGDEQSIAQQTALLEALSRAEKAESALKALTAQEPVATLLCCDPEDERAGFWLSLEDKQRLGKLPAGTKLYADMRGEEGK